MVVFYTVCQFHPFQHKSWILTVVRMHFISPSSSWDLISFARRRSKEHSMLTFPKQYELYDSNMQHQGDFHIPFEDDTGLSDVKTTVRKLPLFPCVVSKSSMKESFEADNLPITRACDSSSTWRFSALRSPIAWTKLSWKRPEVFQLQFASVFVNFSFHWASVSFSESWLSCCDPPYCKHKPELDAACTAALFSHISSQHLSEKQYRIFSFKILIRSESLYGLALLDGVCPLHIL